MNRIGELPFITAATITPCMSNQGRALFSTVGDRADDNSVHTKTARFLCGTCPVMAACAKYAIEHDERWGMWGGMTRVQRERAARKRARTRTLEGASA